MLLGAAVAIGAMAAAVAIFLAVPAGGAALNEQRDRTLKLASGRALEVTGLGDEHSQRGAFDDGFVETYVTALAAAAEVFEATRPLSELLGAATATVYAFRALGQKSPLHGLQLRA
jgi:hypothetical protein